MSMADPATRKILDFLAAIGLPVALAPLAQAGFLPGLRIADGRLALDPSRPFYPGDLLHEAGHIAVTPAALRHKLDGNVDAVDGVPFASEVEATAWAHAATVHLRLPLGILFHEGGYRGRSQDLIRTYSLGVYPGAFGLSQAGMTLIGAAAVEAGQAPYPRMTRWLRD